MTGFPIKRRSLDTCTGEYHVMVKAEIGVRSLTEHRRLTANHQELGVRHGADSLLEGPTLLTPRSQTSSLQNRETIRFCCGTSCLRYFVTAKLCTHFRVCFLLVLSPNGCGNWWRQRATAFSAGTLHLHWEQSPPFPWISDANKRESHIRNPDEQFVLAER